MVNTGISTLLELKAARGEDGSTIHLVPEKRSTKTITTITAMVLILQDRKEVLVTENTGTTIRQDPLAEMEGAGHTIHQVLVRSATIKAFPRPMYIADDCIPCSRQPLTH